MSSAFEEGGWLQDGIYAVRSGGICEDNKDEYPKFSHQIPCFHLTCEKGGKLRRCLELDPLSLPEEFLNVR